MKKIKRLFMRRRNHGFTLVEMIVSVAVLAILLAGMMLLVTPIVQSFNDNNRDLVAENVSTCIQNYITSSIRNASKIAVFGNTNDDQLKAYHNITVDTLKNYCQTKTSGGENAYKLGCISLRYDDTDKRYYLYSETIDTSGLGDTTDPLNAASRFEVFSRCLYDGLYVNYDFGKPLDMDKASETPQPVRKDTMDTAVKTYSNEECTDLVFVGTGLTELRQIKKDIIKNGTKSTCDYKLYNGTDTDEVDQVKSEDGTDDARNIYIYYVVRNLNTATT